MKNEGKKEKEKKSEARLREIHAAAVAVPRIRNTLNHKIRNTLKLKKKKNYLFYTPAKKKNPKKIELKSETKRKKNQYKADH